ncbi:hypothetical protein [Rhizobium sp. AU243]|uniref:hypothetical protein n=1 Tax=Rhizobium sp. AU243 TaxID=2303425 RepID=UPI0010CBC7C2|nr:hypothetical protein [Rhizobium sp. AU243]TKV76726.1 hypothetical protein D0C28_14235 [Rhizobium sp. AU243]
MSIPPEWLPYLQALGPAFAATATLFVGIMVYTVSRRQWRTAHEKLLVDLFDRRIAIYTALETKASDFLKNNSPTQSTFSDPEVFVKSRFLFGDDVYKEVRDFEEAMRTWTKIPHEVHMYEEEKGRLEVLTERNRKAVSRVKKFRDQMPKIFGPFLYLNQTGFRRK